MVSDVPWWAYRCTGVLHWDRTTERGERRRGRNTTDFTTGHSLKFCIQWRLATQMDALNR